ncbi:MAG: hypothetical protein M3O30_17415 [Planctomycetota bacterium]|nr:hypothetical protein [Planctomycetota bacterium]
MTDAQILAALRNALFAFATCGAQEYSIAGRSFRRAEIDKIQSLIVTYEARVAAAAGGGIGGGTVLVTTNNWPNGMGCPSSRGMC